MNFTRCCGSTKYIEAIKENSEVDLKSHQIFSYGELLEDLSLGDMSTTSLRYQYYRIKHKVNIPAHLSMFTDKIQEKHTWMKALACRHFESSTVTLRPLVVAVKMAWSLKVIAFRMLERLRALSKFATKTYCSSSPCDWVERGILALKKGAQIPAVRSL